MYTLENPGPAKRVDVAIAHPMHILPSTPPASKVSLTTNAIIDQYRESIQPMTRLIEQHMNRATWCETSFKVHSPAIYERINDISTEYRRICPAILKLSEINRSNISKYRELNDVMRCHSRNIAYLVQYCKQPMVAPCNGPACRLGLW